MHLDVHFAKDVIGNEDTSVDGDGKAIEPIGQHKIEPVSGFIGAEPIAFVENRLETVGEQQGKLLQSY